MARYTLTVTFTTDQPLAHDQQDLALSQAVDAVRNAVTTTAPTRRWSHHVASIGPSTDRN